MTDQEAQTAAQWAMTCQDVGAKAERAAIVAWLRENDVWGDYTEAAIAIARGDHITHKER